MPLTEPAGRAAGGRLDWVDTGRGIAILLVVLFHATNWIAGTGVDVGAWADVNAVLSSMRMPFFFVLAGLFARKWLTAPWVDVLRSKVLLFLWVLIVWAVIGMVVQSIGLSAAGQPFGLSDAVRSLVLAPLVPPFELWFIWALALFFVVAKATRAVDPRLQLVLTGVISAAALTVWFTTTTGLTGSAKFYFFFLAGLYLRNGVVRLATRRGWILACAFAGWLILSTALFLFDLRGAPGLYFVNCVCGVVAGIALSRALSPFVPLLRSLGRETLPVYLAHTPVVVLISAVLLWSPPLLVAAETLGAFVPPLAAGLAIAVALALHRIAPLCRLGWLYAPPRAVRRVIGGSS